VKMVTEMEVTLEERVKRVMAKRGSDQCG